MRVVFGAVSAILLMWANAAAAANFAFIFKGGQVDLAHEKQVLNSTERTFDETSENAFGIAWEIRKQKGTALGMEYVYYRHTYTPPSTGQAKSRALMFSAKEYLGKTFLRPFFGLGLGLGHTSVTGGADINPDLALVLQLMGGLELRFQRLGIYTEVKGLYFEEDSRGPYDASSGRGVFAGVSFQF